MTVLHDIPDFLIPDNEAQRLRKLYDYQILDTHSEDTFDKIAMVAAQLFETPGAFVSFVDEDRVFLKANTGNVGASMIPRELSPCSFAILKDDVTVFYDTHDFEFLMHSPLISEPGGIRFYAAAPLKSPEGYLLGTLHVADSKPRDTEVPIEKLEMLRSLSEVLINKLESRLRYRNILNSQNELMNITLHEIKNPLASINLANDILRKDISHAPRMTDMIKQSVARIQVKLHDLLKLSEQEESHMQLTIEETDLKAMFDLLMANFDMLASRKGQKIKLEYDESIPKIGIDRKKISDVFHNLLSNAIKYSFFDSEILIRVKQEDSHVRIEFHDQGQGLEPGDIDKLFKKFAKLSAKPTGRETSNGLGLSICKSMVEMHHGNIYAKSEGKNRGSTFIVELPITYEFEPEPELKDL